MNTSAIECGFELGNSKTPPIEIIPGLSMRWDDDGRPYFWPDKPTKQDPNYWAPPAPVVLKAGQKVRYKGSPGEQEITAVVVEDALLTSLTFGPRMAKVKIEIPYPSSTLSHTSSVRVMDLISVLQ